MQVFIRRSMVARLIGAFAGLSLSASSAWAGGGGADATSLQNALDGFCNVFGMAPCPQLFPAVTPLVLEIAALLNAPPDNVRFLNAIVPTDAITVVDPPSLQIVAPGSAGEPSNIAPLAFVNGTVTEPGNTAANSFLYAATDGAPGPTTATGAANINLVFDYLPLKAISFAKGQQIATLLIPLVILSNGTETPAPTTINIVGASCGNATPPCFTASATGSFGTVDPAKLGLTVNFQSLKSENLAMSHAVFTVTAKLLVTTATDPAYFSSDMAYGGNPLFFASFTGNGVPGTGLAPKSQIGFGPVAAKVCASITPDGMSKPAPAVGAYVAIATSATTYLSAARETPVTCP